MDFFMVGGAVFEGGQTLSFCLVAIETFKKVLLVHMTEDKQVINRCKRMLKYRAGIA
jgi:predicted ABC-type transport system involved in lysophospholipase L1 biosynthesis ATPase subunit